jgi:ATP phosphoribosyltransferase
MRIATSYPELTRHLLKEQNVQATIVELSGSVEIAPGLGTADAISDLVSTGTTLRANHLRELDVLFRSEAALYGRIDGISAAKRELLDRLLARLEGVMQAAESKYVMLHAPREALQKITELLPGVEHPSVMPLEGSDRIAVHAVCGEKVFWEHLEALKAAGASAILVLPVEKMLA